MRKIFCSFFIAALAFSSAGAAVHNTCEAAFPGYTESNELVFYQDDSAPCPSGYAPTTEYKFVPDSDSCGAGWTDVSGEFKEIIECDETKGTCNNTFQCIVP